MIRCLMHQHRATNLQTHPNEHADFNCASGVVHCLAAEYPNQTGCDLGGMAIKGRRATVEKSRWVSCNTLKLDQLQSPTESADCCRCRRVTRVCASLPARTGGRRRIAHFPMLRSMKPEQTNSSCDSGAGGESSTEASKRQPPVA